MSKMSKAVAVLGVVAGLGVAAMPLATYAANPETINLNVQVVDKIELSASTQSVNISAQNGHTVDGQEGSVTLTVKTGNTKGYTLAAKTGNTNLVTGTAGEEIPAGAPNVNTSFWGLKGGNASFSTYAGLDTNGKNFNKTKIRIVR